MRDEVMDVVALGVPAGIPEPRRRGHPVPPAAPARTWARSSRSSSSGWSGCLTDRKITLDARPGGDRLAGRQGLRSGLWRAAAEARHPEGAAGPAGREDPARRHPRRLDREGHRRFRPAEFPVEAGGGRSGCRTMTATGADDVGRIQRLLRLAACTTHVVQWGGAHVWKVGGKVFAIGGWNDGEGPGRHLQMLRVAFDILREQPGLRPAPYLASRGMNGSSARPARAWMTERCKDYLRESHRLVALKLTRSSSARRSAWRRASPRCAMYRAAEGLTPSKGRHRAAIFMPGSCWRYREWAGQAVIIHARQAPGACGFRLEIVLGKHRQQSPRHFGALGRPFGRRRARLAPVRHRPSPTVRKSRRHGRNAACASPSPATSRSTSTIWAAGDRRFLYRRSAWHPAATPEPRLPPAAAAA